VRRALSEAGGVEIGLAGYRLPREVITVLIPAERALFDHPARVRRCPAAGL
jgi:hypothetical protein